LGRRKKKNAYAKNGVPRFLIMIIIILNDFVRLCGCTIRQIRTAGGKKTTKIDTKSSMASNQKIETHSGIDEHGKVFFVGRQVHDDDDATGAAGVDVGAGVGVAVDDDVDGVDSIGVGAVTDVVDPEGVAKSSSNFFMVIIKLRLAH